MASLAPLAAFWRQRTMVKALRERCEEALRNLPISVPFDERMLCETLATKRGRPIILWPLPLQALMGERDVLYGLVISKPNADIIVYEQHTGRAHQQQIIAHEAGHLIFNHPSEDLDDAVLPPLPGEILVGGQVRHTHRRTCVWTREEEEAELFASLLLRRDATLQARRQSAARQLVAAVTRLNLAREAKASS